MFANDDAIIFEQRGAIAWIRLNRPQALNAINAEMVDSLEQALDLAERNSDVRALVIIGEGERAFCAGADIGNNKEDEEAHASASTFLEHLNHVFNRLESFPKPVIAAVNGVAAGGGLEMILCCDLVVASETAKLGDAHANYGFLPGGGSTVRLPRKLGVNRAKFLLFTGQFVSAQEMFEAGLVNRVTSVDKLEHSVQEITDIMATKSPLGLRRMKELVNDGLNTPSDVGLRRELLASDLHRRSEDNKEGIAAFQEKRKPLFKGK